MDRLFIIETTRIARESQAIEARLKKLLLKEVK